MPVLLAGIPAEHGMFMGNPKFLQIYYLGFRVLPLLPNKMRLLFFMTGI